MNAAARPSRLSTERCRCSAILLLALLALAGCAPFRPGLPSEPSGREQSTAAARGEGAVIAREAREQIGVPYRYGGDEPRRGFDCSGLVAYVHAREGIAVPRTAAAQFAAARKIDRDDLRPGDLVFFRLVPGSREITHVGIYTGQGRFVHAPQTGRSVGEASLDDPFYRERFAGSGRFYDDGAGAGPRLKSSPR
ncbi:MAG TPA: C40 family peptidase [Steroidobacteraceae bacterium]